jgi:hypothetical protein
LEHLNLKGPAGRVDGATFEKVRASGSQQLNPRGRAIGLRKVGRQGHGHFFTINNGWEINIFYALFTSMYSMRWLNKTY